MNRSIIYIVLLAGFLSGKLSYAQDTKATQSNIEVRVHFAQLIPPDAANTDDYQRHKQNKEQLEDTVRQALTSALANSGLAAMLPERAVLILMGKLKFYHKGVLEKEAVYELFLLSVDKMTDTDASGKIYKKIELKRVVTGVDTPLVEALRFVIGDGVAEIIRETIQPK